MSDLLDILRTQEDSICEGFDRRLGKPDMAPLNSSRAAQGRVLVQALTESLLRPNDTSAARAWAQSISEESSRLNLSFSQVLAGIRVLEQVIRSRAIQQLTHQMALSVSLSELAEATDLLRQCYTELRAESNESDLPQRHELAAVADAVSEFICLATRHGRPFHLNAAGRRLVGLDPNEEIPSPSLHDFHPDDAWEHLRDVAVPEVNRTGCWSGTSQLRNRQTDELIDVESKVLLVREPKSGRSSCLAILHRPDTSENLKQDLIESNARKHAILESSLDPIITINHEGVIAEFNRAAEQVLGHSRRDVLGTLPSEVLFPPSKIAGHQDRIDRYLEAGEGSMLSKRVEVTAVRAGGETFPAEMAMTINQEQGLPVLTFFIRDISERKKADQEQARYAEELERSNSELEQFAYAASHDLQEPLRKIRTFGDRLKLKCADALDETGLECLNRMQSAAERMQDLITGLLTLSRVTTKGQNFVPVDLARVASEVVSDLEIQIEQVGGRVELGKMPTIQADPLQMRQLLQNLIGNALKFHREDEPPLVKVHARFAQGRGHREQDASPEEEQCRLVVEDNGIGFDEKYTDRIFNVFQRLHPRDVYKGTGVGLSICRKIAERHGGNISVESQPGRGTTFSVTLPVMHRKKDN